MNVREIYQPLRMSMVNYGLRRIPSFLENYDVNMDPDYQRGHVWTRAQRQRYLGFLLQGGRGLPIIVNCPDPYTSDTLPESEIVDGKQRLTSILEWLEGDYPATLSDGREVGVDAYKSDEIAWRRLGATGVDLVIGIVSLTRAEVLDYYLRLNSDGTHHTDEEISLVQALLEKERSA